MMSSTTEQDSEDSLFRYRRKPRCQRLVPSTSSETDDSVIACGRRKKCRVSSSSSASDDSDFGRPSRKKCRVLSDSDSESSVSSDCEEQENIQRLRPDKERPEKRALRTDTESDEEPSKAIHPKPSRPVSQTHSSVVDVNSSDSDDCDKCIICFKSLRPPFAHPSNCNHNFHPNCLATWTKTSNTCPIDRVTYTAILVVDGNGDLISQEKVSTPPPQDHNADLEPDDATFCEVCSQHDREHEMLLCDRCESGYHLDCLTPPLREVPDGNWFCPRCSDFGNELEAEIDELMSEGAIILGSRMRHRSSNHHRMPSRPRTRIAQRVFNIIHQQQAIGQPSTSRSSVTVRRRRTSSHRTRRTKTSRRPQSTHYKVELITVEDGTTLEVKVAVNTRTSKSKRHSKRRSKKKCSKRSRRSGGGGGSSRSCETTLSGEGTSQSLDLFGSRPQLDYFSGCEAEDELDEDGGRRSDLSALRRAAVPGIRNMANRKQIAAQIINTQPRRQAPRIDVSRAPVDLVSSIIEQQEKWHSPHASYESTSNGDIRVVLKESRGMKVRPSGSSSASGSGASTSAQASSSSTSRSSRDVVGSSSRSGSSRSSRETTR